MRSSPLRARSGRVAAGLAGSVAAVRPERRFEVAEPARSSCHREGSQRPARDLSRQVRAGQAPVYTLDVHQRPDAPDSKRGSARLSLLTASFGIQTPGAAVFSCATPLGNRQGRGLEKQVLYQLGQRRLSIREETTSGLRERQDQGTCRHCQFAVDTGEHRYRQPRIATRCAVQASWFVM